MLLRIFSIERLLLNSILNSASWRAVIVALIFSLSFSSSFALGFGVFEARICVRMRLSSSIRLISILILSSLVLRLNRRVGITRVLLKIRRSSGLSLLSKSVKVSCVSAFVGSFSDSKR